MQEKWLVQAKKADFEAIGKKYNISPVLARIIRNRDITEDQNINEYLNGTVEDMHSPWLFKDMDKAVDIISIKVKQHNKIRIICDYDIDGICSGFILYDALTYLGAIVDFVVPHRIEDGYGINEQLIDNAFNEGVDTIITCDNGISADNAVKHAKELGMTIVITDHHEVPFTEKDGKIEYIVPQADAVINHKQADCGYPFKELCGAMVAFKFIQALYESNDITNVDVKKYLEYAAIATIGDVVDLTGENRIVTKFGLSRLTHTENLGLNALINECGIDKEKINSYSVGFVLGPCLNASGRLDTARRAVELLGCKSIEKAETIAKELKNLNDSRKEMTEQGVKEAIDIAENYSSDKVLVIYLTNCHESIAGIIAGRIREKYNKPTIVLTKTEKGVKGSGRSIDAYDMYTELSKIKQLFTKFGGHKLAAGLSLEEHNVDIFRSRINEECKLTEDDLIPKVWIDTELPVNYITYNLITQLSLLEPFGKGNPKPVFAAKNVKVVRMKIVGKTGNVLNFTLKDGSGYTITAVCFNKSTEFIDFVNNKFGNEELKKASRGEDNNILLKIVYYPTINVYNEKSTIQIVIDRFC